MGELLYEWNELEQAERHLTQAVELGRRWGNAEALAGSYLWLARLRWARDDTEGVHTAVGRAQQLVEHGVLAEMRAAVASFRAWLALQQGDLLAAERWAQALGLDAAQATIYPREKDFLIFARLLLARDELDQAGQLLDRIFRSAERVGRVSLSLEVQLLMALAAQARGNADRAMRILEEAVATAEPEGYVRTFVDEGAPMQQLLTGLDQRPANRALPSTTSGSARQRRYVQRLLAAFPSSDDGVPAPAARSPSTLAEQLSERETEVLRLVAKGHTNREIADQLFIAVSTVKSHTNSIYGKLGVRNRTQAIAAAEALSLL
jgi:LuxR family maltose regulon positive regulatory protein